MAKVTINDETLTGIATAIREKNQTETTYKPSEMAGAIQEIKGGLPSNGFMVNAFDENGFATDVSIYNSNGYVPENYCRSESSVYGALLNRLKIVRLSDNITEIKKSAFTNCIYLETVEGIERVDTLNTSNFLGCSLLNFNKLNDNITSIPGYCFQGNWVLSLSCLPENLNSLGERCFLSCSELCITKIPIGVTYIPSYAFYNCNSLTKLNINGDVTYVGDNSFRICSSLNYVAFPNVNSVPTLANTNAFASTPIESGTGYIYVPDTLVDSFKAATNWSTYADQIKPISEMPTE